MRVGVIPDTHFPAEHPAALAFLCDTFDAWGVERLVHIGDVVDLHAASFHDKNPMMPGPLDEYKQAHETVARWSKVFRDNGWVSSKNPLMVCLGNHCERSYRVAAAGGVIESFMRPHHDVWGTTDWVWALEHELDGVLYTHGHKGCGGGKNPALLTLEKGLDMPVVLGHFHTRGGIAPLAGRKTLRWGMNVGCLVDRLHPAMAYASGGSQKQIMSCGVVIDGHPYYEMMPCGPGEKYHRSKFKKKGGRR
jgi:predicted phosphodiesterase